MTISIRTKFCIVNTTGVSNFLILQNFKFCRQWQQRRTKCRS